MCLKIGRLGYKIEIKQENGMPQCLSLYFASDRQDFYKEAWISFFDKNNNEIFKRKICDHVQRKKICLRIVLNENEMKKLDSTKSSEINYKIEFLQNKN